jgi:hypothetical protein
MTVLLGFTLYVIGFATGAAWVLSNTRSPAERRVSAEFEMFKRRWRRRWRALRQRRGRNLSLRRET